MPYIRQEKRDKMFSHIRDLSDLITCEGDFNYIISVLAHRELMKNGVNYQRINNLIGALECAKLELYRVIAAPYENTKISENGHVSPLDSDFLENKE